MYNKHKEVEEEAYKILREYVGKDMNPDLINALTDIKNDLNVRYKDEYHIDFEPIGGVETAFVVNVKVYTVH